MANYSLYLNGVFEGVLEEIRKAQADKPDLICYLQPYSSSTIIKLSKDSLNLTNKITLYISPTSSLSFVSYRAEIVGWENKKEINSNRMAELNSHIDNFQPNETEIYMKGGNGKDSVNLISVINMKRLVTPIPVSSFIKISNNTSLKSRSTSGGWSYVRPLPNWVGELSETMTLEDFNKETEKNIRQSQLFNNLAMEKHLYASSKIPEVIQIISKGFKRNANVIAYVLERANGLCEKCGSPAPFKRAKDNTPYLEVHHKVMLSQKGEDTIENAIAVCPNCHRELHFGA